MRLQKTLLVCLLFAAVLSLTACGKTQPPADQAQPSDSTAARDFKTEFLPVGSVVLLEDGNKTIMICGRIQSMAGSDTIYDYSACYYPEVIIDPKAMIFFNREDIAEVCFVGYEDESELTYRDKLNHLGELEIKDGVIVEKQP